MKLQLSKKGFTLIELLVVISIIALLSTIIVAFIKDTRSKAQWRKFESELDQIILAISIYKNTYGVFPDQQIGPMNPSGYMPGGVAYDGDYNLITTLTELKNKKLFPNDRIVLPKEVVSFYGYPGAKTVNLSSISCGDGSYSSVYYYIWIETNQTNINTTLPKMYEDGLIIDQEGLYCIDIR